jgi:hypothetical protein
VCSFRIVDETSVVVDLGVEDVQAVLDVAVGRQGFVPGGSAAFPAAAGACPHFGRHAGSPVVSDDLADAKHLGVKQISSHETRLGVGVSRRSGDDVDLPERSNPTKALPRVFATLTRYDPDNVAVLPAIRLRGHR